MAERSEQSKNLARVRYLAEHGTPQQQQRAKLYLRALQPKKGR